MLASVASLVAEISREILRIYDSNSYETWKKEDASPLTSADLRANELLKTGLKKITPHLAVLSEEDPAPEVLPDEFWIVDPIDGTKDFVGRTGQFSINVALVKNLEGVIGVIGAPTQNAVFYAEKNLGAFQDGQAIQRRKPEGKLIATVSNFHTNKKTEEFLKRAGIEGRMNCGSALKFCRLAVGDAHVYPRFSPTSRWDVIAGQIIAEETGCFVTDFISKKRLKFPKENIKNPYFIAYCPEAETPEFMTALAGDIT